MASHLNTGGIATYLLTLIREQTKAGHEVFLWGSDGNCAASFRECASRVISDVPRCKSELSLRLWGQLPKLMSFLIKYPVHIIHAHTRVTQVLTAAATRFIPVPFVSTSHMFYKRRLGRRLFPCWGRVVIAISRTMRDGLIGTFGEKNLPPVRIIRNGIDVEALRARVERVDREAVREEYGYEEGHRVVLALSRLIPVKGIHIAIDAFSMACQQVPEMKLLIAGDGDVSYIEKLKEQVERLGIQKEVRFLGNVDQTEKPFKVADIFVAPYLWPEAFGLSVLEAMAAGLPVVGSDSGGISELLGGGKRGLLFQEANVPELARCLVDYAKSPELRSGMGRAAAQAALEYSSKLMSDQICEVYEEALGGKE
ncbi:MAG: glycosyltransferase family 4 protein [Candidatus Omnitrophica bacterium]|nr:glycosyltransferase family 4 protein [Candidatus Omnitrophota bacterium]